MTSEIIVPDNIKELINKIIAQHKLDSSSKIIYNAGSELGDGFMSKTVAVDIVSSQKEDLHLFVKYALNAAHLESRGLNKIYDNEKQFYEVIAPAYVEFLEEKGLEEIFRNVPKCYATPEGVVVLENLRKKGYELCDRELIANDEHLTIVLKTYAKLHAISFAFRDQKPEEYQKILAGITDVFRLKVDAETVEKQLEASKNTINSFLNQLDPVKDRYILNHSEALVEKALEFTTSMRDIVFDNSVLVQGDSWCNNMMFKYNDDKSIPLDVMLIDWQVIRPAPPVFDLSYFFYTAAASSKESLNKLDYYLEVYHEELSAQIRKMGSDPEKIYSLSTLKTEWKRFCMFGYTLAYIILRAMLSAKDEAPNFEEKDMVATTAEEMFPALKKSDEWIDRLRNLTEHLLKNDFL